MGIRKITPLFSFDDLNLKPKTLELIRAAGITPEQLVTEARHDVARESWLAQRFESHLEGHDGIGKVRAQEIIAAVDEGGFILHEDSGSRWARRLLVQAKCSLTQLLDHYEDLENMSPEAIASVDKLVRKALTDQKWQILKLHFGLEGDCLTFKDCAARLNIATSQQARELCISALVKLRSPDLIKKLELATCHSRESLGREIEKQKAIVAKAQQRLDDLREYSPYPEYAKNTTLIEELELDEHNRTRILNCLRRSGITTVEQLVDTKMQDLQNIRNLGDACIGDIIEALAKRGLTLKS